MYFNFYLLPFTYFTMFLDLIYPKLCLGCKKFGRYICTSCISKLPKLNSICPVCEKASIDGLTHVGCVKKRSLDGLTSIWPYSGVIRKSMISMKYKFAFEIAKDLSAYAESNLYDIFTIGKFSNAVLVPIPAHRSRENWRGFNQAKILGETLSKRFKQQYLEILSRTKDTKPQVELKKKERLENIKGAFDIHSSCHSEKSLRHPEFSSGSQLRGKNFMLIDDVYTSGATMQEACRILKRAGAKTVWAMAVALG